MRAWMRDAVLSFRSLHRLKVITGGGYGLILDALTSLALF